MTLSEFTQRLNGARRTGSGYTARCPAHEDQRPSLSVSEAQDGKILIKCHAGCSVAAVLGAMGLSVRDLFPRGCGSSAYGPKGRIVATYDYRDADGRLLFQVCRFEPKDFRQRRPDPSAPEGWSWKTSGIKKVLYRLPELIAAVAEGDIIFVAEGEKDVNALVERGFSATCNPGGAGKWLATYNAFLAGAKVVIIVDKDKCGREHARNVAVGLHERANSVKKLELPDVNDRKVKDAHDYFAAGGTPAELNELVEKTPGFLPGMNPSEWFKHRFPGLAEKYGEPAMEESSPGGITKVADLGEDFVAAVLGRSGMPDAPTVYVNSEARFYTYLRGEGVFQQKSEEDLAARLSAILLECARECRECCDVTRLEFKLRNTASLSGAVGRARSHLAVPASYFDHEMTEIIPLKNGMLRVDDRALVSFSPEYRRRNKLQVAFDRKADAPMFVHRLMESALDVDDVALLQRWCGLALIGNNLAQKILLLTGTAGGGKGTFVRVVTGIIGLDNIGSLRTRHLDDRFETGRFFGKTLLYGADVPGDFLSAEAAGVLKSLTGGDPMQAEFKTINRAPVTTAQFNVLITSNCHLAVRLHGDADSWRRRLVVVRYSRSAPRNLIPNFSEQILAQEGSGVLNWMLDGLDALKAANWELGLNDRQRRRTDDLLLESDSHRVFVYEHLVRDAGSPGITVTEAFLAYVDFCASRGWTSLSRNQFGKLVPEVVATALSVAIRHDVMGADGKLQKGWKHVTFARQEEIPSKTTIIPPDGNLDVSPTMPAPELPSPFRSFRPETSETFIAHRGGCTNGANNVTVRRSRLTLRGKGVAGWRCETTLLSIPHAQTPPHL